ncbi:zinc finger, PHD-type containing protein, partial [Tanacetum coccineum]
TSAVAGTSAVSKDYKDSDFPDLLHLPFPDQSDVLNHFVGESGSRAFETNLTHPFHRHPLTLVDTPSCNNDITTTPTSSRITTSSIHDSMKMVEVVCNACIRPITNLPFYKCTASDDGCNFVLHAWCTRLPADVKMMDDSHTFNFKLLLQVPKCMGVFECGCEPCKFIIHSDCALLWPDTISHKYDKHQLTLRYFPVENYSGDYFCEVCEEEFNPNGAFYHCDKCVQSMHPACCVPIPQKETTYTPPFYIHRGVAQFDNVKFGKKFMVNGHPHDVSLCRGVRSDGECAKCDEHLQDKLILKCLQCMFAIDIFCALKYVYSPKPIV